MLPAGEDLFAAIELADLDPAGIYGVELTSDAAVTEALRWTSCHITNTPEETYDYVSALTYVVDRGVGYVIQPPPETPVWLQLWPDTDALGAAVLVTLRFLTGAIEDSYPDSDVPRALSLADGTAEGVLSAFPVSSEEFLLTGLTESRIYRARVEYGTALPVTPLSPYRGAQSQDLLEPTQKSEDTWVGSLLCGLADPAEATKLKVYGEGGCTFTLAVEDVDVSFPDDEWESDNGPVAPGLETIVDDGTAVSFHGELHTLRPGDEDWVRFTPLSGTTYTVTPTLIDGLVDPDLPVYSYSAILVCASLVGSEGSFVEVGAVRVTYARPAAGEWASTGEIEWTAPSAAGVFVRLSGRDGYRGSNRGVPFSYRIRVTADR